MTTYPLPLPSLQLTINGEDYSDLLERRTLQISRHLGGQADIAEFQLTPLSTTSVSRKPTEGQVVIVEAKVATDSDWTRLFGGVILRIPEPRIAVKHVAWQVVATDFSQYLRRLLVQEVYGQMTVTDIVRAMVRRYGPQVRTSGVGTSNRVLASYTASYRYPADCLEELAGLIGWEWYVDPFGVLHFYDPLGAAAESALTLTDTSANFQNLSIEPQLDQVRNRVYVQASEALSDEISELWVCNGQERDWQLQNRNIVPTPDTDGDLVLRFVTLNGTWRASAPQGSVPEETVEFMVDLANGKVRVTNGYATPADLSVLEFRYRYRYPLSVVVEDVESQALVAALAVQYPAIVMNATDSDPETPPTGYWKLDEKVLSTCADSSGNGHDGAYNQFVVGDLGRAGVLIGDADATGAYFDGDQGSGRNYIRIPHHADLNLGGTSGLSFNPFAIALWVRQNYADQSSARMLLNKGDAVSVRLHWHGRGIVSLTSTTYGALAGIADLGLTVTNNCQIQLPDDQWHLVVFTFQWDFLSTALVEGYLDGEQVFSHNDAIVMNNAAVTDDLFIGARDTTLQNHFGLLTQVTVWNGENIDGDVAARLYHAAQESGVREVQISAGDVQRAVEARAVGQVELAKWSRVITRIGWDSYVHGWEIGTRVPITLTYAGTGRQFDGEAKIQGIDIVAEGAQRLRWRIRCEAARFNLIDYYRQLVRQAEYMRPVNMGVVPKMAAIDARYQAIAIDGPVATTQLGLLQYIAPDEMVGGSTPYLKVEFGILQQEVYG